MSNAIPLISVGMPTFNGGPWIESSVESILAQTLTDFELIICDNASTDNTEEICHQLAANDARIRYIRHPKNLGIIENYNAVAKLARGKYFKWASCNDYCAPEFLALCLPVLEERSDVVLCYPRTRIFSSDIADAQDYNDPNELQQLDSTTRYITLRQKLELNNMFNGLIRTETLNRTHLMRNFYASDLNLIAELILHGKFVQVNEPLFYRRISPETATILFNEKDFSDFFYPDGKKKTKFPILRYQMEYFAGISRSPISWSEKIRLYGYSLHEVYWDKERLVAEFGEFLGLKNKTTLSSTK